LTCVNVHRAGIAQSYAPVLNATLGDNLMSILRKTALAAATTAVFASTSALAYEKGDMMLRVGAAGVYPTGESDSLDAVPGGKVEADSAWSLGITFTYMLTDQLGLGVLGAWPFEHDIDPKGNLKAVTGSGSVGETKQLPPTVTLQWHFPTGSSFHPYVGAGVNYTYFFDEDTKGALGDTGADLDIDDSWGLAAEVGLDYELQNEWLLSGQIWYISIEPEAKVTGGTLALDEKIDVEIDPWVFMLSAGKKF
jgi:outer membrane protein